MNGQDYGESLVTHMNLRPSQIPITYSLSELLTHLRQVNGTCDVRSPFTCVNGVTCEGCKDESEWKDSVLKLTYHSPTFINSPLRSSSPSTVHDTLERWCERCGSRESLCPYRSYAPSHSQHDAVREERVAAHSFVHTRDPFAHTTYRRSSTHDGRMERG